MNLKKIIYASLQIIKKPARIFIILPKLSEKQKGKIIINQY